MNKVAALIALGLFASQASGALYVYEPFDQDTSGGNTKLEGKTSAYNGQVWQTMGTGDEIVILPNSLNYPAPSGYPTPVGGSATYGGAGKTERLAFGPDVQTGSVYYSYMLKVTSLAGVPAAGSFIGGFNNLEGPSTGGPGTIGTRLFIRPLSTDATNSFQIGVSKNGANTLATYSPTIYTIASGETQFIVGEYEIVGDTTTTDVASMWINPTSFGGAEPAGSISSTDGADLNDGGSPVVRSFLYRQSTGVANVVVDELRVGTTYADVTPIPEPAMLGLAATGGLALLRRRRQA